MLPMSSAAVVLSLTMTGKNLLGDQTLVDSLI